MKESVRIRVVEEGNEGGSMWVGWIGVCFLYLLLVFFVWGEVGIELVRKGEEESCRVFRFWGCVKWGFVFVFGT